MANPKGAGRLAAAALLALSSPFLHGSIGPRTSFDERVLAAHNRERDRQGVAPLRWNPDLAIGARAWASYLARTGQFKHSPDEVGVMPLGENIWGGTPRAFQPEAMVGLWLAEKRNYRTGIFPENSRTGNVEDVSHYTQLIWRRSGEVGCALAHGRAEDILVCRYNESGNVVGEPPL